MFNSKKANVKNGSKRYSRMRNAIEIGLIFTALCAVLPTPVQAKVFTSSQFNSFSDAEVQTTSQKEVTFSEEEIQKGGDRVDKLIESYENELKQNGTKKPQEELVKSRYIASLLKGLDKNALGKCAYNFNLLQFKESRFNFISLNDEILDCELSGVNVTEKYKQGEKNVKEELARRQSEYALDGKTKSEEEFKSDELISYLLGEQLFTEEELNYAFIYNNTNVQELSSNQLSNLSYGLLGIYSKLLFLANEASRGCYIETYEDEDEFIVMLNDLYYLYYRKKIKDEWADYTHFMNDKLKEQKQNLIEFQQ